MKLRSTLVLLLLGFTLVSQPALATAPAKHRVRIGSFRVERDITPGRNKVVGTLTNISRTPIHQAKVRFRLFDARWHGIGVATDEVQNLGPGQTWTFHAQAAGNVSHARLVSVQVR
jgi:hypothetical protein